MDLDWTLSWDREEEMRLREMRNQMIEAQLKEGKTVAYRQSGWSLYPKVHSNDLCCYIPVRFEEQVLEGGVVFCLVQPHSMYYAHLVKHKEWHHLEKKTGSGSRTSKAT